MLQTVLRISKHLIIVSFLTAAGCATTDSEIESGTVPALGLKKVFVHNFDSVWRAAQLAIKYPIATNNMDTGVLETDWIRGPDGFIPPGTFAQPLSAGVKYKITVTMSKGKLDNRESVRVSILKTIQKHRDFFSDADSLKSDGLEEKALLYRIEREVLIEESLKKAARAGKL